MENGAQITEDRWNGHVRLHPQDRFVRAVFLWCIPQWVRPNHVTAFRMVLTPVVLAFLVLEIWWVAVPLFIFAAITDMIDGSLARTRKQITEWGTLFDPLADKLLIGSVLFVIVLGHVNYVLGWAILAIESIMIGGAMIRRRNGVVTPANVWGKVKMVMEVIGITLLLIALWLHVNILVDLSIGTLVIALVVAILSILPHLHR